MTPEQVEMIVGMAVACFPNYQTRDMRPTFAAWSMLLGHLDFKVAQAALAKLVSSGAKFFPSPGEILEHADEVLHPERMTAAEAWAEVKAAVRFVGYMGTPVWSNEAIGRAVEGLGGWLSVCQSENEMADRAHFLRLYAQEYQRDKERDLLPPAIQQEIAGIQARQLADQAPQLRAITGGRGA